MSSSKGNDAKPESAGATTAKEDYQDVTAENISEFM